jgi:PEP-CTERM motif
MLWGSICKLLHDSLGILSQYEQFSAESELLYYYCGRVARPDPGTQWVPDRCWFWAPSTSTCERGDTLKLRIGCLSLLALCLAVVPAVAQTDLYDNGPTTGTTNAWTIGSGFIVSDTFTLSSNSSVTGLNFIAWLFPGDTLQSAEVSITSSEFGGTTFFDGTINFTASDCSTNQLGANVCTESGTFSAVALNAGSYWLNLQNGVTNTGDPAYWDENSGPSSASQNSVGTIPSESFTLLGGSTTSQTTTTSTTPEPSSIMLFGSGILGLAGILRRKLF